MCSEPEYQEHCTKTQEEASLFQGALCEPVTGPSKGRDGSQAGLCVLTVEALLVHDGAAAQGLVVLLVTHERVHAQDSCGDKGRPMTLILWAETSSGIYFLHVESFAHRNGKKHVHKNVKLWIIFILAFMRVILRHLTSQDLSLVVATDFQIPLRSNGYTHPTQPNRMSLSSKCLFQGGYFCLLPCLSDSFDLLSSLSLSHLLCLYLCPG